MSDAPFEPQEPADAPPAPGQLPASPRPPEHPALLTAGLLFFAMLLGLAIYNMVTTPRQSVTPLETQQLRMATNMVTWLYRMELGGMGGLHLFMEQNALETADRWESLLNNPSAFDPLTPELRARMWLNVAALRGVAEDDDAAHTAITQAAAQETGKAAVYRLFLPLYADPPQPVVFSPAAEAELDAASGGALLRARNALLRDDKAGALAALAPAAQLGMRTVILAGSMVMLFGGILLTALILLRVRWQEILRTLQGLTFPPAAQVPWGIGAALFVVSLSFLLPGILSSGIVHFLKLKDTSTELLIHGAGNLVGPALFASLFLVLLGKKPWQWRVLGWRRSDRGFWYILGALLLTMPVVWLATIISALLFHDYIEMNPLIPVLSGTTNPWVMIGLALMAAVQAPLIEETLFRGILFRALDARLAFWTAAPISAILFSAIHGQLVGLLPIFVLAVLLALLTRRTGSLVAPAIAHALFNGVSVGLVLLQSWATRGS